MIRFLRFCVVLLVAFVPIIVLGQPSNQQMSSDLSSILHLRASIDTLSGTGKTYRAFADSYLRELSDFQSKYSTPFQVFALRPTLDRSLSYRLGIQKYSLSCEIAALRIILGALGIDRTEDAILGGIPQFPSIYSTGGIWGDPDTEFVGQYNGGQSKKTGYGVYEKPLANYARKLSLHTEIYNQYTYSGGMDPLSHFSMLLEKLNNKNTHILLWGDFCTDPVGEDGVLAKGGAWILPYFPLPARNHCNTMSSRLRTLSWVTPDGKNITALSGEHAFVLLGYIGKTKNPSHIIVWDTSTGRHVYPYSEWMRKWSLMDYRSLIISRQ